MSLNILPSGSSPTSLFYSMDPRIINLIDLIYFCSWEYGTRAEALLELNAPTYSVVSFNAVPPPHTIPSNITSALGEVFTIAHNIVVAQSLSNIAGPQPLMADTSAGDPASIGVAVLLANWTGQGALDGLNYAGAARDQLEYLFQNVSKTSDGAISHRIDQLQLW
jgi:hypothetical protein